MKTIKTITLLLFAVFFALFNVSAEETPGFNSDLNYAQVEYVKAVQNSNGSWTFSVTVRHNDEGWNHYADLWEVVDTKTKKVFAQRILAHPHETEQPFTRSQSGINFPKGQRFVDVRAKCKLHGFGGKTVVLDLETDGGKEYSLERKR